MVTSVLSHVNVRVCGKGKSIIQETEYRPHAISGEITLSHILCISFMSLQHTAFSTFIKDHVVT